MGSHDLIRHQVLRSSSSILLPPVHFHPTIPRLLAPRLIGRPASTNSLTEVGHPHLRLGALLLPRLDLLHLSWAINRAASSNTRTHTSSDSILKTYHLTNSHDCIFYDSKSSLLFIFALFIGPRTHNTRFADPIYISFMLKARFQPILVIPARLGSTQILLSEAQCQCYFTCLSLSCHSVI